MSGASTRSSSAAVELERRKPADTPPETIEVGLDRLGEALDAMIAARADKGAPAPHLGEDTQGLSPPPHVDRAHTGHWI